LKKLALSLTLPMRGNGYGLFNWCSFFMTVIVILHPCASFTKVPDYSILKNRHPHLENRHPAMHFECPNISLPDHVDYVVVIGGFPGGGGRTVVRTLEMLFNLYFGKRDHDLIHSSLDSRAFIQPSAMLQQGATDVGQCHNCDSRDWPARFCAVQNVIGPMGSSPDHYKEVDRWEICAAMGRVHKKFNITFAQGQRIWIFKYAESIMFIPLLDRIYGNRFRFIWNVRNPICHHRFAYFYEFRTFDCFHPIKDMIWRLVKKI